ncbi:MAG: hypothetical protein HFJ27_04335 [Clostridia bacterium]|nr:hypothetical protein [Clostridia bacterium]
MDEEQNEQNEQQNSNGVEELAKQGINKGVDAGKKFIGQKAKNAIKTKIIAMLPTILPIVAWLVLGFAIIGALVAAFNWAVDNFASDTVNEKAKELVGNYCIVTEQGIKFDKEEIRKEIENQLANGGIDKEKLEFGLEEEEAAELLYEMIATSMANQLPYIEGSEKDAQGIIYLYRDVNQDGIIEETEQMEFIRTNKI